MNNVKISVRFVPVIISVLILVVPNVSLGQVSYKATEDALKQLIKDIEKVRKAPVDVNMAKASGGKMPLPKIHIR